MDAHEYIYIYILYNQNLNILCIFGRSVLWSSFVSGFCLAPVSRVDWFDDQSGSNNIGLEQEPRSLTLWWQRQQEVA
jgi:hypothetical protein